MEFTDLKPEHIESIKRFVASDAYLEIKDAFVSHTPEAGPEGKAGECDSKNLGKLLGTRYVFNKLEQIARKPKQPDTGRPKNREQTRPGSDPDLE